MSITESYLEKGKQLLSEYPLAYATDEDIEAWATEIAQGMNLNYRDIVPMLRERPSWIDDHPVWPEVEAEYFTIYWVMQHHLKDYLEVELEAYGKGKQEVAL